MMIVNANQVWRSQVTTQHYFVNRISADGAQAWVTECDKDGGRAHRQGGFDMDIRRFSQTIGRLRPLVFVRKL